MLSLYDLVIFNSICHKDQQLNLKSLFRLNNRDLSLVYLDIIDCESVYIWTVDFRDAVEIADRTENNSAL